MKNRLDSGLIGRARRVLLIGGLAVAMIGVAPAQQAFAQDIGDEIAATVAAAVSTIDTDSSSGGTVIGGISTQSNTAEFGEDEGTALSDASGGDHNVSDPNAGRRG
jgi:predicted flavoprotein YhiN